MISFTFGGKNSYEDFGIIISKRPNLPSPKRRVSYLEIDGRDSSLRIDNETYEDITIAVECKIKDGNLLDKIDEIKAWLFSAGESDLIFSFQKKKKYIAQVVNSIDFSQVAKVFSEFIIIFNCRPFKYDVNNAPININQQTSKINNNGALPSEPIITVYGTGDVNLTIGKTSIQLKSIQEFVVVDSQLMDSYKGTELRNNFMIGDFPLLEKGENEVTWTGTVTKISIVPNIRYI